MDLSSIVRELSNIQNKKNEPFLVICVVFLNFPQESWETVSTSFDNPLKEKLTQKSERWVAFSYLLLQISNLYLDNKPYNHILTIDLRTYDSSMQTIQQDVIDGFGKHTFCYASFYLSFSGRLATIICMSG